MNMFKREIIKLFKQLLAENNGMEYTIHGYDFINKDGHLYCKDLDLDDFEPDTIHDFKEVVFKNEDIDTIVDDLQHFCDAVDEYKAKIKNMNEDEKRKIKHE